MVTLSYPPYFALYDSASHSPFTFSNLLYGYQITDPLIEPPTGIITLLHRLIRDGAWVEGKKVFGRKLLAEPIRCLKCQEVNAGHIAAKCPSNHEVCARCGESHRTDMCTAANGDRACANCRKEGKSHQGHGAADRACPVFQTKLQQSLERNRDAKYPYFLIENAPDTWNTHEELSTALGKTGATPTWKETQAQTMRNERGPESSAHANGPRTGATQTRHEGRRLFQPTLAEAMARAKVSEKLPAPPLDPRMHPSRAAQMLGGDAQCEVGTSTEPQTQRTPSPLPDPWTEDDEAAIKEIEDQEALIAARKETLATRKAKWKAKLPAGPITFNFHDDGVEYARTTRDPTPKNTLPPASDDEDDIEIERTLAPVAHSSPGSVGDRNVR